MDACNMNLVELGYELREHVHYMIASQDEVPDGSWPYDRILKKLAEELDRQLGPQQVSQISDMPAFVRAVAEAYTANYQDYVDQPVALSGLDLSKSHCIRDSFLKLTDILQQHSKNRQIHDAIFYARSRVRSFYTRVLETRDLHTRDIYIDLLHFCNLLKKYLTGHEHQLKIGHYITTIDDFIKAFKLDASHNNSIIVANESSANEDNCNGTSIYFPANTDDQFGSFYDDLDFSGQTGWVEFIKDFLKHNPVVPIPPIPATQLNDASRRVKGNRIDHSKGSPIDHGKGSRIDHSKGNPIDHSKHVQGVRNLPSLNAMHYSEEVNTPCIHNVIYNYSTIVQTCGDDSDDEDVSPADSSGS